MDGCADDEIFPGGFRAHYGDGTGGGEGLQVEVIDWVLDAANLVGFCLLRRQVYGGKRFSESREAEEEDREHCDEILVARMCKKGRK